MSKTRVADGVAASQAEFDSSSGIRVDALERFVEFLSPVNEDPTSDDFYSRLCEATCQLAGMDRAVIFRYDEVLRRVRAVGAHGIELKIFATADLTVESAPIARQALEEDRVIEISEASERAVPAAHKYLLRDATLVCTPISAAGRWSGVILSDRAPRRPLTQEERHLLWTLGKTAALATYARVATSQHEKTRRLQERIDLTRDIHEGVIQRLFGVLLAFSSEAELTRDARDRCADELQAALLDLRRALQRPLGRMIPRTYTTLLAEIERLSTLHPDLGITLAPSSEQPPNRVEGLAQSVLAEAVRNAHKHAQPTTVNVTTKRAEGAWVMEVLNDGVNLNPTGQQLGVGVGLRLAGLEALQVGGILEFGKSEPGTWRVRLTVPDARA